MIFHIYIYIYIYGGVYTGSYTGYYTVYTGYYTVYGFFSLSCVKELPPQGGRLEARDKQGAPTPGSPWWAPCVPGWSAHGHMRAPTRGDSGQVWAASAAVGEKKQGP